MTLWFIMQGCGIVGCAARGFAVGVPLALAQLWSLDGGRADRCLEIGLACELAPGQDVFVVVVVILLSLLSKNVAMQDT
jgi:hypothetical protein